MLTATIKVNADKVATLALRRIAEHEDGTRDYEGVLFRGGSAFPREFILKGHRPSKPDGALRLIAEAIRELYPQEPQA